MKLARLGGVVVAAIPLTLTYFVCTPPAIGAPQNGHFSFSGSGGDGSITLTGTSEVSMSSDTNSPSGSSPSSSGGGWSNLPRRG